MKKIKYEKPVVFDAGPVAAIQGAGCSVGSAAADNCNPGSTAAGGGCASGNNPTWVFACKPTGSVANGNCYATGTIAGESCNMGSSAAWYNCVTGNGYS